MGYSIIFQTKIVKLDDGRIIHFDRSGCNNDDQGREKNIYTATISNIEDFVNKAKSYMKDSKPYKECGNFELKIGSRYCTLYDYGKHLLTMLKRAENLKQFEKNNFFRGELYKGIEVKHPFNKIYFKKDYPNIHYDMMYRKGDFEGVTDKVIYQRIIKYFNNINDCINLIENNEPMEFCVIKRRTK